MNSYPNHPRFITVAEFDARGQYQNVNVAPLVATESTDTTAVYDVHANQTPVLVPHLAPFGKDWLWSSNAQKWTLIDNYAVIPVYSKSRVEQCTPPQFGDELTDDMTLKVPPSEPGKITYWDAKNGDWATRDDLTGKQVFSTADPRQSLVLGRDDWSVPHGYTETPQPTPAHSWDAKSGDWVLDKAKQAELDAQAAKQAAEAALVNIKHALQAHIDGVARGLGFTDGNSVMLYTGFNNSFRALAEAFGAWEAGIWVLANEQMSLVKAGKKAMPSLTEAVGMIPAFVPPSAN